MTGASTSDSTCATNLLATYTYDDYSRRKTLTYAGSANASMSYTYTNAGDLLSLAIDMVGTGNDNTWTLQYTPAHQLSSDAPSNTAWLWQKPTCTSSCTDTYTAVNVLNQYPKVQPAGSSIPVLQSWDADGNLQKDGSFLWGYDQENRLLSACKPVNCTSPTVNAAYAYDPLGRRQEKSGTGVTATVFLQDGSDEIAEYDTSGNLQRRFVPGPAINEPIAMVPASGTTEFVYTDHHDSVVATSDSTGSLVEGPFVYDPSGNCYTGTNHTTACASAGGIPFRFTGQFLDFETGCNYYRARMMCSDSTHGMRFLQTDPVGYKNDLDFYTYVHNDPLNRMDPTGLAESPSTPCQMAGSYCTVSGARTAPIYGTAQKPNGPNGPAHAQESTQIAKLASETPGVKSVHLNQTLRTASGGKIDSSLQPDVTVVMEDGRVIPIEVKSPSQTEDYLRNVKYADLIGKGSGGVTLQRPILGSDLQVSSAEVFAAEASEEGAAESGVKAMERALSVIGVISMAVGIAAEQRQLEHDKMYCA